MIKINTLTTDHGSVTVSGRTEYEAYQNFAAVHFELGLLLDEMEKKLCLKNKKACGNIELEGSVIGNFIKNVL